MYIYIYIYISRKNAPSHSILFLPKVHTVTPCFFPAYSSPNATIAHRMYLAFAVNQYINKSSAQFRGPSKAGKIGEEAQIPLTPRKVTTPIPTRRSISHEIPKYREKKSRRIIHDPLCIIRPIRAPRLPLSLMYIIWNLQRRLLLPLLLRRS